MAKYQKRKPISILSQFIRIKQKYKNVDKQHSQYKRNEMNVRLYITPTEDSEIYTIDIKYKLGFRPRVLLIKPQLKTFNNKKPHHL